MTNLEYLNALVPEVPEGIKEAIMTSRSVTAAAVYDGSAAIELAEADLYRRLLLMPDFAEGSLKVKYDRNQLEKQANGIYRKHDDPKYDDGIPIIKRVTL